MQSCLLTFTHMNVHHYTHGHKSARAHTYTDSDGQVFQRGVRYQTSVLAAAKDVRGSDV